MGFPTLLGTGSISSYAKYGDILNQTTWASLTGYTSHGAASFSASSNKILESGGSNVLTDYLTYDSWYTRMEKYSITRNFTVNATPSASTYGTGIGVASVSVAYQSVFCKLDCTNTANQGKISIYGIDKSNVQLAIVTASSGHTIVNGDSITMNISKNGYTISASVTNNTQGWNDSVSYTQDLSYADINTTFYTPNVGYFAIWTFGGTFNTTKFEISTTNPVLPKLIVVGNSKAVGSFQGVSQNARWFDSVQSSIGATIINLSNFGDKVSVEMIAAKAELIALIGTGVGVKVLFADVAANDIRGAVASATWQAAYNNLVQAVEDLGVTHFHCVLPEANFGTGVDTTAMKTFIINNGWNYSDTWTAMGGYPATVGLITPEGIHPGPTAVSVIAPVIVSSFNSFTSNPYDASAVTYFTRYSVAPSSTDKRIISDFYRGVKFDNSLLPSGSLSTLFDAIWLMANPYQDGAKFNLISNSFSLTEVASPSWTSYQGYTGNGTSSYLNTGLAPSATTIASQNSFSYGIYLRNNSAVAGQSGAVNAGNTSWVVIGPKFTDNKMYFGVNSALADFGASATTITDSLGLKSAKRTNSTTVVAYDRSNVLLNQTTGASAARTTQIIYIGARNNAGTADSFDVRQISFAFIGIGTISIPNLYTRIQALMTSFGTQV